MRAVIIDDFGPPENLHISSMPCPQPIEGEIQIEVAYAAVNPVDWKICQGKLKHMFREWAFPLIPGWDVAGRVAGVGSETSGFRVGDEVFAYCRKPICQWGTYAEYVCCPFSSAAFKPKTLTMAQAAAIPLVALTAWQTLFDYCKLSAGMTILVHAGAGGVGSFAIQMAKRIGAYVYTTASRANHEYVKDLGADVAIDYCNDDFVQRMQELEPEGVDVVYDCVGKEVLTRSYPLVKRGGCLPTIAAAHDKAILQERDIQGICLIVRPNGQQLTEIGRLIDDGQLKVPRVEELALEQAEEAHRRSQKGHTVGKLVLKVK